MYVDDAPVLSSYSLFLVFYLSLDDTVYGQGQEKAQQDGAKLGGMVVCAHPVRYIVIS